MKFPRFILVVFLIAILGSCSSGGSGSGSESHDLQPVVENVSNLEDWSEHNPIEVFLEQAEDEAEEIIEISKGNMEQALYKAKDYDHCLIVVDNHTIVRIEDLEDCTKSGSWNACMPMAKGYIQKGKLVSQKDYINNIIGRPDLQQRKMFLFGKKQAE